MACNFCTSRKSELKKTFYNIVAMNWERQKRLKKAVAENQQNQLRQTRISKKLLR